MRNWNTPAKHNTYVNQLRFYRTYEELKLVPVPHFPPGSVSFYRTYEELKQTCGQDGDSGYGRFLSYLWGIETIYRRNE